MNTRTALVALGFAVAATLPAAAAHAQAPAPSTVTIKAQGTDLSGKVKSSRQSCKTDRKVVVWKQIGARGGGDDQKMSSDLAGDLGPLLREDPRHAQVQGRHQPHHPRPPLTRSVQIATSRRWVGPCSSLGPAGAGGAAGAAVWRSGAEVRNR